jgi:perosamine synthetase
VKESDHTIPHSRPDITEEDVQAVASVLRSGGIAQGRETERFERETAAFVRAAAGAAVSSGTAALHLALQAAGLRIGDRVAVPAYCCASVLAGVRLAGCSPVLVDVDPARLVMDIDNLRARVASGDLAGVVFVHLLGYFGPIDELGSPAIPVIEDCAQSLGARIRGRHAGSFGTASVLSFYATKLMTTAEGGMVLSDDAGLVAKVKAMRCSRESARGRAYPYAMNDMEAALGRSQLARFPLFLERRREIARIYRRELAGTALEYIEGADATEPACYRFIVRLPAGEPGPVIEAMAEKGIECRRPFEEPLSILLGEDLPGAREAYATLLSIPLYPSLAYDEVMRVARALKDVLAGVRA